MRARAVKPPQIVRGGAGLFNLCNYALPKLHCDLASRTLAWCGHVAAVVRLRLPGGDRATDASPVAVRARRARAERRQTLVFCSPDTPHAGVVRSPVVRARPARARVIGDMSDWTS